MQGSQCYLTTIACYMCTADKLTLKPQTNLVQLTTMLWQPQSCKGTQTCQLVSNLAPVIEEGSQVKYGETSRSGCRVVPDMTIVDAPCQ